MTARWLLIITLIAAIAACLVWLPLNEWLDIGVAWIGSHRAIAWLAYIGVYVLATVLVLPGSILTLVAGFVFGLPLGVALTSAGSTLGACSAFLVGRYLARPWVQRRFASSASFEALDAAAQRQGFQIVLLARLSPVFPFNLLNYGLALTGVRFRDYVLASWIGMLPATILYVYAGTAAASLSQITGGTVQTGIAGRVLLIAGLIATLLLTALVARRASRLLGRQLQQELDDTEPGA